MAPAVEVRHRREAVAAEARRRRRRRRVRQRRVARPLARRLAEEAAALRAGRSGPLHFQAAYEAAGQGEAPGEEEARS